MSGDPAARGEIRVLAAAQRWAVVEKPAGMLSVPGKGQDKADCAAARIRVAFPHARGPLVVHRLDMETSGLMLFALEEDAQRILSRQFEERTVEKSYTALLGPPTGPADGTSADRGEISLPMRPDIDRRPLQIVDPVHGREAITRWRILAREIDRVRIQLQPLTGRTHQLRVHAALGLSRPIIGDVLYGGEPAERLMLHASYLSFLDPSSGARLEFRSPAPF